jgi:CDGSH-type Zn-finger protein
MKLVFNKKIKIMFKTPKCGCGNTLDPNGFCDGSHSKK